MENVTVNVEEIMRGIRETIARPTNINIPDFSTIPITNDTQPTIPVVETAKTPAVELNETPTKSVPGVSDAEVEAAQRQLNNDVQYLQNNAVNPYFWDLGKGIKGIMRRTVRRLGRCLGMTICDRQTAFNQHVAETADILRANLGLNQQTCMLWNSDRMTEIRVLQGANNNRQVEIKALQEANVDRMDEIRMLQEANGDRMDELKTLQETSAGQKVGIEFLQVANSDRMTEIETLQEANNNRMDEIRLLQEASNGQKEGIEFLQVANSDRMTEIKILQEANNDRMEEIRMLQKANSDQMAEIQPLRVANNERIEEIKFLRVANNDRMQEIASLQRINNDYMAQICQLQEANQKLQSQVTAMEKQLIKLVMRLQ